MDFFVFVREIFLPNSQLSYINEFGVLYMEYYINESGEILMNILNYARG